MECIYTEILMLLGTQAPPVDKPKIATAWSSPKIIVAVLE